MADAGDAEIREQTQKDGTKPVRVFGAMKFAAGVTAGRRYCPAIFRASGRIAGTVVVSADMHRDARVKSPHFSPWPSLPRETPRICRGGSENSTFAAV